MTVPSFRARAASRTYFPRTLIVRLSYGTNRFEAAHSGG